MAVGDHLRWPAAAHKRPLVGLPYPNPPTSDAETRRRGPKAGLYRSTGRYSSARTATIVRDGNGHALA
jgi:hypothetical protein